MTVLLLCLVTVLLTLSSADEGSNSNEVQDHASSVDVGNLLLDYNHDQGPNSTMPVTLSIYVTQASWSKQKLKATFYFRQMWRDHRLKFVGDKDVQIPARYDIWEPDTFLSNSMRTTSSGDRFRRLSPDGTVFKSVKLTTTVPCDAGAALLLVNDGLVNCELWFESYGFSGVSLIRYQWKDHDAVGFNEKTKIKSISNATMEATPSSTPKHPKAGTELTAVYPRAIATIEIQTALTTQVLEYIVLDKSDL